MYAIAEPNRPTKPKPASSSSDRRRLNPDEVGILEVFRDGKHAAGPQHASDGLNRQPDAMRMDTSSRVSATTTMALTTSSWGLFAPISVWAASPASGSNSSTLFSVRRATTTNTSPHAMAAKALI